MRDLAELNVMLLESKSRGGRYVAAGRYYAWGDLFDQIEALTGRRLRRVPAPAPVLRVAGVVADVVKRVFPFSLPTTRESMEFATRWQTADAAATEAKLSRVCCPEPALPWEPDALACRRSGPCR